MAIFRLFGWVSKLLLTTVLICTISVLTTWTVVQLYVNQLLTSFQLEQYTNQVKLSDVLFTSIGLTNKPGPLPQVKKDPITQEQTDLSPAGTDSDHESLPGAQQNSDPDAQHSHPDAQQEAHHDSQPDSQLTESKPQGQDAIAVWGQQGQRVGQQQIGREQSEQSLQSGQVEQRSRLNEVVMSESEFNEKKEQLSTEDKMNIFTLLIAKLSEEQLQRISMLMEQGITMEELHEMDHLLKEHLNTEDYDKLLQILTKYE